jgi:hypothetical protein
MNRLGSVQDEKQKHGRMEIEVIKLAVLGGSGVATPRTDQCVVAL